MSIRKLIVVATAVWASATAEAGASANPYGGGTRLTGPPPAEIPTGRISQQDKARIVAVRFAACLIKARRSAVLNAIKPEPWERDAGRMLVNVVDEQCLERGELAFPPNLLRGAFYQVLYREKFSSGPPALPLAAIDFSAGGGGHLTDDAKTDIALRQFGDCVARRDIKNAHALVLSTAGSYAETDAVNALVPDFSACLVQGSKWTLNRSSVAAILSEVLYREGVSAQEQATNLQSNK